MRGILFSLTVNVFVIMYFYACVWQFHLVQNTADITLHKNHKLFFFLFK